MKKQEMVRRVASEAGCTQDQALKAIDSFVWIITDSLENDRSILIQGLGGFSLSKRKARRGHNPATREAIHIAAMSTAKFKPSADLKRKVKNVWL